MASLGASERVDVPWVTLMGSPSITARLPGVVAQRVHAAAGTCITDEHKARGRQRAGATQRGATTSVCASLCQSFVAEVSRGGVLKTQTIFGPQLFKAVNKVFKSTSWFPWYKSFSLTCKAQRKFHPSIPNFYLKRHLGYSYSRRNGDAAAGHGHAHVWRWDLHGRVVRRQAARARRNGLHQRQQVRAARGRVCGRLRRHAAEAAWTREAAAGGSGRERGAWCVSGRRACPAGGGVARWQPAAGHD